jgi:hypothetical protein
MTDYRRALDVLRGGGVRFIVIGGVAELEAILRATP